MKQNKSLLLLAATAVLLSQSFDASAQDIQVSDSWGSRNLQTNGEGGGTSSEEDALLQSLYSEEDDEELARMLQSEDYIFPSSITDNWHLMLQAGAMNSWGSWDGHASWLKRDNFAASFSIGKYLTPVNDVRLSFFYGRGTGVRGADSNFIEPSTEYEQWRDVYGNEYEPTYPYHQNESYFDGCPLLGREGHTHAITEDGLADYHTYHWNVFGFTAAWLPNLTNLFRGYNPDRKFTVSALMGISLEHTTAYTDKNLSIVSVWAEKAAAGTNRTLIGLKFGLECDWNFTDRWQFNAEVSQNVLDDSFDGLVSDDSWDGHLNMLLGVTYFLKGKRTSGRIQNRNPLQDKYLNYTEKIYQNREAIDDALASRKENVAIVNVTKDVTYTLISFDEGAMEVPRLQQNNVFQTAEAYRRIPNSKIFITNSNKQDNSMFHQRAWAISKLLYQRWQIPLEDVWVDSDESHIQTLQIPDCKHYIIFIINEE